VLYGSVKYNSLDADKVSITMIESLAILDLLVISTFMVSTWLTMVARRWVLGSAGCLIFGFVSYVSANTEMVLVQAISCHRLFVLTFPFVAWNLTRSHVKCGVIGLVVVVVLTQIVGHVIGLVWYFDPNVLCCQFTTLTNHSPTTLAYHSIVLAVFVYMPIIVLPVCNIAILVIATVKHRSTNRINRNALITVSCISWTFILSIIPTIIRIVLLTLTQVKLPTWYSIFSNEMYYVNSIANPLIYTTVNRWGTFLQFPSFTKYSRSIFCSFALEYFRLFLVIKSMSSRRFRGFVVRLLTGKKVYRAKGSSVGDDNGTDAMRVTRFSTVSATGSGVLVNEVAVKM